MKVYGAVVALRQAFMAIPYRDLAVDQAAVLASVINAFPSIQASLGSPNHESANNHAAGGRNISALSINNLVVEDTISAGPSTSSSGNGGGSGTGRVYGNGSSVIQMNH